MAAYTTAEYADILFIYGYCDSNVAEACREYERRFPNRYNVTVTYQMLVYSVRHMDKLLKLAPWNVNGVTLALLAFIN